MKKSLKWKIAQKLEQKWWTNYLDGKNPVEYRTWKINYWNELLKTIETHIPLPKNKTVLDAGCGPAGIFMALENNEVTAIDPLLDKYVELEHFNADLFLYVRFQKCAIEELSDTDKYDYIFCLNAINHVNDLPLSYDKLINALKPNGYLIISTDAHRSAFLKKIFQCIPGDMLHPHQYSIDEYDAFLKERKMTILNNILYKQEFIFDYVITVAQKL